VIVLSFVGGASTRHSDHLRFGERPPPLDLDRDELERPARRESLRPSHGSPGPEILICGMGDGGAPVVLSRARRHFSTGMRLSPWSDFTVSRCLYVWYILVVFKLCNSTYTTLLLHLRKDIP
jgi:hypothetical protein